MTELYETLEGSVKKIVFYNAETGYCVLRLAPPEVFIDNVITVVGTTGELAEGETVRAEGTWTMNPRYGRQFKANSIQRILPVTEEGIVKYLGSGLLKGVGKVTAQKIVDHFGMETLRILDSKDAVMRLLEVDTIGRNRAQKVIDAWQDHRKIAEVMMFLQAYGIGTITAIKIYRFYESQELNAIRVLQEDPYQLIRDIHGIGFKKADQIAMNLGIAKDAPSRLQAALLHVLQVSTSEGHVFLPVEDMFEKAIELLELDEPPLLEIALHQLKQMGEVREDVVLNPYNNRLITVIYEPSLYSSELGAARVLRELNNPEASSLRRFTRMNAFEFHLLFEDIAETQHIQLTDQQQEAVKTALLNPISILTGGPGTGKTTTMRSVIAALKAMSYKFKLASPTGRAAKRLSQATGENASTIHRLLGYTSKDGYVHNQENTLETDFVVIDEASMLDLHLFYALIRAIRTGTHLLFVGDVDQLPSVGAGDVLRDLIRSEVCPITRLNVIFRQEGGSQIIENAHLINRGQMPIVDNKSDDFFFFNKQDPIEAADLLVDIVKNRIPEKFGYNPISDVQVLSPMYRTPIGVKSLNEALQEKLNPANDQAEGLFAGQLFRVGDKVMQTRNNYEKGVFNGDIGTIYSINFEKRQLTLVIDDLFYEYEYEDTDQLTLAYACTVHRAQGGEYPVVVFPILTQHYIMLQRNLLYTAVTRAKELVVLVGTHKAVQIAVSNNQIARRWSALDWRLTRENRL